VAPRAVQQALLLLAVAGCLVAPVAHATYPGRNGRIAFVSPACPRPGLTCTETIRPDGSDRRRLGEFIGASWSASGRRVLGFAAAGLVLANNRGDVLRTVPRPTGPDGTQLFPYVAELSPDARTIAFVHDVDLHMQPEVLVPWIWTMATDGTGLRRLRPGERPRWTPDGRRLVFDWVSRYGSYRGIGAMPADGRPARLLLGAGARLIDLSPDGRRLLWWGSRRPGAQHGRRVGGLFTSDLNGAGAHLISRSHPSGAGSWSPDGEKVVFAADDPKRRGVFTADAEGGRLRRVLRRPYAGLSWQPRPR
jgi:Tol biopolymer transport system component